MNCPRCGREMVIQGEQALCRACRISTVVEKTVPVVSPPQVSKETPDTSIEIDPDDIEEGSANADGFPKEVNQVPDKEAEE